MRFALMLSVTKAHKRARDNNHAPLLGVILPTPLYSHLQSSSMRIADFSLPVEPEDRETKDMLREGEKVGRRCTRPP